MQRVKDKLRMLGCTIIKSNDFGLYYSDSNKSGYNVILFDINGTSKLLSDTFDTVEIGPRMIVTSSFYRFANGIYIDSRYTEDKIENLLEGSKESIVYTFNNVLTYKGNISPPYDRLVVIQSNNTDINEYRLINYKGRILRLYIRQDSDFASPLVLRDDKRYGGYHLSFLQFDAYKGERTILDILDDDLNLRIRPNVDNRAYIDKIIQERPKVKVLYQCN